MSIYRCISSNSIFWICFCRHIENWSGLQELRGVDMELYTGLQRLWVPHCNHIFLIWHLRERIASDGILAWASFTVAFSSQPHIKSVSPRPALKWSNNAAEVARKFNYIPQHPPSGQDLLYLIQSATVDAHIFTWLFISRASSLTRASQTSSSFRLQLYL